MKRSNLAATIALAASLTTPTFAQDEAKPEVAADPKPLLQAEPLAPLEKKLPAADSVDPDKVLVKVDGVAITQKDADQRFLAMYGPRLATMEPDQAALMREHAMASIKEELIAKTLLLAAADKAEIGIDEAKKKEMMDGVMSGLPEGKTMDQFLADMKMDAAAFDKAIAEEVRINALIDKQTESLEKPSDEVTKQFYETNKAQFDESVTASHILVKTEGITEPAELAKKKAELEDIRKQLIEKKGENFAELAMAHSDCPSKAEGGSLGRFGHGQMVPAFDKAAFAQEVGEIGEIIETNFGYHVIMVEAKSPPISYEEIKDRIADHLMSEPKDAAIGAYIDGLREKATIEDLTAPKTEPIEPPAPPAIPLPPAPPAPAE